VSHKSFTLSNPDRIVLDLVGADNAVRVTSRTVPAGPVTNVRISQYARDPQPVTRIVADLRQASSFEVSRVGTKLVLAVSPQSVPAAQVAVAPKAASVPEASKEPQAIIEVQPPAAASVTEDAAPSAPASVQESPAATSTEPAAAPTTETNAPAESAVAEAPAAPVMTPRLAAAYRRSGHAPEDMQAPAPQTPQQPITVQESNGKRINLDLQGADIRTVLRTLSDYAGKNIIAGKDVDGEVNARIKDAPWEDALAAILKAHGYAYVEENGIIRVGEMAKIRNEELEEVAAARKREDLLPIVTEVVRLEFANAGELKTSLAEMLTNRGRLQVDSRTNALIVSDIRLNVEKIGSMARELDGRTQQVEIVSKLVDVSADDTKNLGIEWAITNLSVGDVTGSAGVSALTPGAVGALRVGTVQSWGQLDLMLDALARSKKANIVSNPNITTVNNREAKILVGAKIPLIVADEAGNAITQLTTVGIQMRVTPHVNSDRTITLDLHPEVSELSSQATVQGGVIINTSEADTRVVVNDGETAIIGGLIRDVQSEVKTGIPLLMDLPGIGWLFRNSNKSNDKRELIIFVTPKMLETASLGGQQFDDKK
jgi:type IV pilus assembly protein PilQ